MREVIFKGKNFRELPDDVKAPRTGNNVVVFAEDMRYPKPKVLVDQFGREIGEDKTYPIVWQDMKSNLVIDWGRKMLLCKIFGLNVNTPSGDSHVLAGSVGDSGASPTDNTLVGLKSELIANATRIALTDIAGSSLATSDVAAEVSGANFWKIVAQFIFDTTDLNNTQTFAEFGLHDVNTLPSGSVPHTIATSGNMFARFVPSSSFVKSSSFRVTCQWSIRA